MGRYADDTAGCLHRLGDERRDRFRALALDQRTKLVGQPGGKVGLALPVECLPIVVRAFGMQKPGERQVEIPDSENRGIPNWLVRP